MNVKNIHRSECNPENTSEFFSNSTWICFSALFWVCGDVSSAYDKTDHIFIIFVSMRNMYTLGTFGTLEMLRMND